MNGPMTATEILMRQEEWGRRVQESWGRTVLGPLVNTYVDALYQIFPPPYFWLGEDAEWPEVVFQ